MQSVLDSIRRPPPPALKVRRYEGAAGGRRFANVPTSLSPIADAHAARGPVAAKARHFTQNNGPAAKAVEELVSALIGSGIGCQSMHPDPAIRKRIEDAWYHWTRQADHAGRTTLDGLMAQAARSWVISGEAFLQFRYTGERLRLLLLDPEQIDPAMTRDLGGGARIVAGIEFDAEGRRSAYHILRDPPGQPFATVREASRVSAEDVIHLFIPLAPGQARGVSWLAPSLLKLSEHDQASDAMIVKQKTVAMFTAFVIDQSGGTGGFEGESSGATLEGGMEPGTIKILEPGQDVRFSEPGGVGPEANDFMKAQLREIAAGIGVTYEMMSGDLSGTNYSSIRAGLLDFRRRIDALRRQVLFPQVLEPVWRRWLMTEALAGRLDAAILRDFDIAAAVEFIPPGWAWVDPQKEIAADREAVAAGFKSRREVVAARGRDIDALDAEIAADRARSQALNLEFGAAARPAASPPAAGLVAAGGGADRDDNAPEAEA